MTHTRNTREISQAGSILDENAGSVLSENQHSAIDAAEARAAYWRRAFDHLAQDYDALVHAVSETAPEVKKLEQLAATQLEDLLAKDARIQELEQQLQAFRAEDRRLRERVREQFDARVDDLRKIDRLEAMLRSQNR